VASVALSETGMRHAFYITARKMREDIPLYYTLPGVAKRRTGCL